jgi:transposase-like protein
LGERVSFVIVGILPAEVKEPDMEIYCPFCRSEAVKVHQRSARTHSAIYRCMMCDFFFSERRLTGRTLVGRWSEASGPLGFTT